MEVRRPGRLKTPDMRDEAGGPEADAEGGCEVLADEEGGPDAVHF